VPLCGIDRQRHRLLRHGARGGGAPSYEAAAAVACDGYPDTLAHKTRAWWPAVPRFRLEPETDA
jgi:hypothetical protein